MEQFAISGEEVASVVSFQEQSKKSAGNQRSEGHGEARKNAVVAGGTSLSAAKGVVKGEKASICPTRNCGSTLGVGGET